MRHLTAIPVHNEEAHLEPVLGEVLRFAEDALVVDDGYAMPLQVWVQAVEHGMSIVEVPVPLIYLDEARAFGGALDDAAFRLNHYRAVFREALRRSGLEVAGGCR